MKKKLGELLIERRLITPSQLSDALTLQRRNGMRLGAALVARGHLDETQLVGALGALLGVPVVDLGAIEPDPEAVGRVRKAFASEHDLFPFKIRRERGRTVLTVAMSDPLNYRVVDELGFVTNTTIETVLARASDIDAVIRKHYGARFDQPHYGRSAPVRLDSNGSEPEMTILRPGGGEERVNTETGPIRSPFIAQPPEPSPRKAPPRDESALLLTEEVTDSAPVAPAHSSPISRPAQAPNSGPAQAPNSGPAQAPNSGPAQAPISRPAQAPISGPTPSSTQTPIPLTEVKRPGPDFDANLGALIDAAGDAVNAEAFSRLERKFWALMRVLAKKGVLTNEDFLAELRDD